MFLKEEDEGGKLKHITHAEDRPLQKGSEGFGHAVGALQQAHEHIKSGGHSTALTMKYDGSPSLVFGHHPETGKFFVASKSAFNKNPKINYTNKDIEKNHGHAPGLVEKLKHALEHLPKVSPKKGVYQGDVMFSGEDKKETKHGVSFTPNTITYSAKGEEGDRIRKAKFGVVVHQQYHGNDIASMKADASPDVHNFKQHEDVWHKSAEHDSSKINYSEKDQEQFRKHIDSAQKIHDKMGQQMYHVTEPHRGEGGHLETYINQTVRTGEKPTAKGLQKHIQNKFVKAASKLKTPAAQSRKETEAKSHVQHIEGNAEHYNNLLNMHHHLQQAKNVLVKNLEKNTGGLEHHIDGKPTGPEGFVVNYGGEPTKLVNRAEFARANLLKVRKPSIEDKPKQTKKKAVKVDYENDPQ
jgi:hypothetical protein